MGLKLVPQEKKDGKIFYNWHAYPNIIEDALKAPAYLQMPDHYLNVEAKYVYPYEINYRVDVINGKAYKHGTTDQLFYTNPETQVDIKAAGKMPALRKGRNRRQKRLWLQRIQRRMQIHHLEKSKIRNDVQNKDHQRCRQKTA